MNPKVIGIITGAGPEAGIDLWRKIIKYNKIHYTKYKGDIDANHVVVHSVPKLAYAMDIENNEGQLWETLREVILRIDNDVDFFCIACNILHYFEPKIKELDLKSEFISIIDETKEYLMFEELEKIGLLSIPKVMQLGKYSPYSSLKDFIDIETVCEGEIENVIESIKVYGADDISVTHRFEEIIKKIKSKNIVLACTELPLLDKSRFNRNFVDPTSILAKSIVSRVNDIM